jgi:hypothetical protein
LRRLPPERAGQGFVALYIPAVALFARGRFLDDMSDSSVEHYRGLSATYTDAIRASDFKANIVMFFLSLTMGPIIFNHDKFPHFLTMPILVAPFLIMFLALFVALVPRYPRRGRSSFFISGKATPQDFAYRGPNPNEAQDLQLRVAILSDILYWKTMCLRVAFFICIACVLVSAPLLAIYAR